MLQSFSVQWLYFGETRSQNVIELTING
jgi:hypothetical protein